MNKYLETHNLKDGQKIKMDDTLKKLLDVPADVQLTFLNIQRYMNKHYIKEETEKKPRAKEAGATSTEVAPGAEAGPSDTAPQRRRSCAPRWPSPPQLPELTVYV
jgi:hypothetical protein